MTMNAASNEVEDGIPAVNSTASTDIGSVGSNSTKTRFSFYNAQEVEQQRQQLTSNDHAVVITSSITNEDEVDKTIKGKGDEGISNKETPEEDVQPLKEEDNDSKTSMISHQRSTSSSEHHHRFTFYVAEEGNGSPGTEDRRSPAAIPEVSDANKANNTRTPAAATSTAISNIDTDTSATTTSKQVPTPLAHAETPQRSNNRASSQKKKQRARAAAEARSKSTSSSNASSHASSLNDNTSRNTHDSTLGSVEILQSLKDTEQMRENLMKECHRNNSENNDDNTSSSQGASQKQQQQQQQEQASSKATTTNVQRTQVQEQQGTLSSFSDYSGSDSYRHHDNSFQERLTSATAALSLAVSQNSSRDSNPYEDAIREALDLLRKHRPPSPTEQDGDADASGHDTIHANWPTRTPREADRILQSRRQHDSPTSHHHHHNVEELEARKKERQERMARYTTRLAELKNGEDAAKPSNSFEDDNKGTKNQYSVASHIQETAECTSSVDDAKLRASSYSPPPPQTVVQTSSSNLAGDISLGTASSLSASHYNPQNQKEVHRSVERVLLAILERAHSNGRGPMHTASCGSNSSSQVPQQQLQQQHLEPTPDPSWQSGEEKKSYMEDGDECAPNAIPSTPPQTPEDDPLFRAVGELLTSSSGGGSRSSGSLHNRKSQQSSVTSATRRSVVEELLAEAESFSSDNRRTRNHTNRNHRTATGTQSLNGKQSKEDIMNSSTGVEAVRSDTDVASVVVDKELDALVMKTLGRTSSKRYVAESSADEEDYDEDYDGEEGSHGRSYDDEEGEEGSYDEDETDEDEDLLEGVLGPLSKNAGTTGVVLEAPTSPGNRSSGERSMFDSLSNAMSSLVASAMSGEEKQQNLPQIASNDSKVIPRDKYATDMDLLEHEREDQEATDTSFEEDEEANELMRTLCAHLLPFGVDQSNRFLDEVPNWDDSNPNEAGYRIIRLTSQQLERVEIAFETMVHGLEKDSERNLLDRDNKNSSDATFERDLAAAEKVLEEEDRTKNRTTKIMKVLNLVPETPTSVEDSRATLSDDDSESESGDDLSIDAASTRADGCHPDFPGVHSAGKGEMGDLEYFHLPVIFKSQVTGFEPTKDLLLEPGNIVAGQYLVESELGSAAFSTAYRCVDLNSEGDDTEDGHQEVCLKVIKNTKDFFDQSLDEIKILELLRQTGKCHQNNIIEMKTFFYHREHLIIVTELLRQNLFEFGKFILDHDEESYFTMSRLGYITRQVLIALRFVHKLGLVHSDVKPENILLGSYSRAHVKLIDFGSSCYLTDRQSSYIQSRSYRAPEVILGLPYNGKIDVWSLGCVVAEMYTGEVTFQNDSIVSMLSRIEAICGPFPRHMIAQGRQSCRFFTKCGLLYEKVPGNEDGQKMPDESDDDEDDDESDIGRRSSRSVYDIFQPKTTTFSTRLGFAPDIHDRYLAGTKLSPLEQKQGMFVDFIRKLLTIDPDSRPTAAEALKHPWMIYVATLTEDDVKYPSP